ncbi:hypothetical protein, partial [Pseudomonas sp. F16(2018)]|uniref:hypothetical protein n=1 Tax=Pseudomonas sp. F16(2018) TaxID=2093746 RepID=UPI001C49903D
STLYPAEGNTTLHMTFGEKTATGWPAHLDVQALAVQLRAPPASQMSGPAGSEDVPASSPPPRLTVSGSADWGNIMN